MKAALIACACMLPAATSLAEPLPTVEVNDRIVIRSDDGAFAWRPVGRIMADYIWTDDDETELESGGELRRARLGLEATLWHHWTGKLEVDFAENELDVKDAYVGYASGYGAGTWWIRAGQQHVPFGFATLTSSRYMTFMNRPIYADDEIEPARQLGVAAFANGPRWTAHAGIFTSNLDEPTDCEAGTECDQEFAAGLRVTVIPVMKDRTHLVHVGGGVLYRDPNGATIDIDQRDAVIHIIESKNLNADFEGQADDAFAYNLELGGVWGPLHAFAQYVDMDVDREPAGLSDVTLDAWSVDVGFFLTGESKHYDAGKAQWGGLRPNGIVGQGGIGAWEIAVRYEEADYNDPGAGFTGGEMHLLTVGLNWYVNDAMRFMANYVTTLDYSEPGSGDDGDEPGAFMVRGQIHW